VQIAKTETEGFRARPRTSGIKDPAWEKIIMIDEKKNEEELFTKKIISNDGGLLESSVEKRATTHRFENSANRTTGGL